MGEGVVSSLGLQIFEFSAAFAAREHVGGWSVG